MQCAMSRDTVTWDAITVPTGPHVVVVVASNPASCAGLDSKLAEPLHAQVICYICNKL